MQLGRIETTKLSLLSFLSGFHGCFRGLQAAGAGSSVGDAASEERAHRNQGFTRQNGLQRRPNFAAKTGLKLPSPS